MEQEDGTYMHKLQTQRTFVIEEKANCLRDAEKEMSEYFGKNCFWVFEKFKNSRAKIDRAYDIAKKTGDRDFRHFMQNIYH